MPPFNPPRARLAGVSALLLVFLAAPRALLAAEAPVPVADAADRLQRVIEHPDRERIPDKQRRYEAGVSWGRAVSSRLSLRLTLGEAYSELAVAGGGAQARLLWRPTGSLSAALKLGPGLELNLQL